MGREVRMVPKDWRHPKDDAGSYKPLFDGDDYERRKNDWLASVAEKGLQETIDYDGNAPDQNDYMPSWKAEDRTHFMMYENTSEGTPISPAFATPEELARWLANNKASAFGSMTASYDDWLRMIGRGSAVSLVVADGEMMSGVEA